MGRKTDKAESAAGQSPAAAELAMLNPAISIVVAKRSITIREYGFFEGLRIATAAAAFIADMHAQARDGVLRFDRIRRLFGKHEDVVIDIAAQAADVDPEWVRGLNRTDMDTFFSAWFGVNVSFFVNEVVLEIREELQRVGKASPGVTSSPASPPPGSATSDPSAISPSVS